MYTKVCECCGQEFQTSQPKKQLCDRQHYKTCVICGDQFPVNKRNWQTKKCCSRACLDQYNRQSGKARLSADKANLTKKRKYYDKGVTFNAPKHTRICKICGKEFQPRNANQQVCDSAHYKTCEVCGALFEVTSKTYRSKRTCSKKCRYDLVRLTSLSLYGVDNAAKSEQFKEKMRNTCLRNFGVECAFQSESVKEKSRQTNLRKYGVSYSTQSKVVQQKSKQTMNRKYGVDYYPQAPEYRGKTVKTCSERYGTFWPCLSPGTVSSGKGISSINCLFGELLSEFNVPFSFEFVLDNRSYDIKVGNVLVEMNPTESHNSFISLYKDKSGKSVDYHISKSKLAESHGYRCIHVWDWDDWEKVVRLVIPTSRRVYARKCQVVELDKKATDKFLSDNHLQGTCKGQTVRLGLTHNDELVEVMTFGKPRYNRKFEWELLRLCALPGTSVVGGPSKLFSRFVREYNPKSILSYCDRSKFTGKVYESIGMTLTDEGTPNKHWYSPKKSERMQHVTNNFLLQRGFDQIFGTSYGKGTNNEQLMLERGYLPVYDCGQMRFEWHK